MAAERGGECHHWPSAAQYFVGPLFADLESARRERADWATTYPGDEFRIVKRQIAPWIVTDQSASRKGSHSSDGAS